MKKSYRVKSKPPTRGLPLIWNDTLLSSRVLHHHSDPSLQQVHSIRHFDKLYNHPDDVRAIFILTQTQLSRRSCCVATTLHRPRRYIRFESIWLTPSKTISATWLDTQYVTQPPRTSSLGRPTSHHSVVHVFTTGPLHASPLGCAWLRHTAAPRVTTWLDT